jgi:hypothetical protein
MSGESHGFRLPNSRRLLVAYVTEYVRKVFLSAVRTQAMAEICFRSSSDIPFNLLPIPVDVPNLLAIGADRQ